MKVHLNQGNDIENAPQMVDAMKSSNGVPGLSVTLCNSLLTPSPLFHAKLDGVSSLSDIEYEKKYLRVWKAYGIGSGKQHCAKRRIYGPAYSRKRKGKLQVFRNF